MFDIGRAKIPGEKTLKKILTTLALVALLTVGVSHVSARTAPKSVIHVVTVNWKEGPTPEQIKAALDGAQALPAKYKSVTHVWTRAIKNQADKKSATEGCSNWWAHWDSNPEPKDYAYHFGFRRRPSVRGLDHAFTVFCEGRI